MNNRPSSIRVFGSSLVANPFAPQFRAYRYNGSDRIPTKPTKLKTGTDSPPCEEPGCDSPSHAVRLCTAHYYRYRAALKNDPSIKRAPIQRGFVADACGTTRGYQRHKYWDVPVCDDCQNAKSIDDRARKARSRARKKEMVA